MNKKYLLKVAAAVIIIAAILAPAFIVAAHAGHTCTGIDCDICKTTALCKEIMRLTFVMLIVAATLYAICTGDAAYSRKSKVAVHCTPVHLKVRLLN